MLSYQEPLTALVRSVKRRRKRKRPQQQVQRKESGKVKVVENDGKLGFGESFGLVDRVERRV